MRACTLPLMPWLSLGWITETCSNEATPKKHLEATTGAEHSSADCSVGS